MGNGHHCAISELGLDGLLNEVIRFHVNGGGGLVQHQNLCFSEQCSRKT
jgi:hypothetical protein